MRELTPRADTSRLVRNRPGATLSAGGHIAPPVVEGLRVLAQRILDFGLRGGSWFLAPPKSAFFVSDGWGTSYAALSLRKLDTQTLDEITHVRTFDSVRNLIIQPNEGNLVACTFKRILVLESENLTERARISKIGQAHDALAFDPEGDHLVVGSGFGNIIKIIDTSRWAPTARKRAGPASTAVTGFEPHQVILFHGPSGRIAWYDSLDGKVVAEKRFSPFRPAAVFGAVAYLGTGNPEPMGKMILPSGEERPTPFQVVKHCTGVTLVDLISREVRAQLDLSPFGSLQFSTSGRLLFAAAKGRVTAIDTESTKLAFEWTLPDTLLPMAILEEGSRAIVVDDRSKMERILLLARD